LVRVRRRLLGAHPRALGAGRRAAHGREARVQDQR
jgi:hypothetical protein